MPTTLADLVQFDRQLRDAGRHHLVLEVVGRKRPLGAGRTRQADHRQRVHHRRRAVPLLRGADPGRRQDQPVLAGDVPLPQRHGLRPHPSGEPGAGLEDLAAQDARRPRSGSITWRSSSPTTSSAWSAAGTRRCRSRSSGWSTSAPRWSDWSRSCCSSCSCRTASMTAGVKRRCRRRRRPTRQRSETTLSLTRGSGRPV